MGRSRSIGVFTDYVGAYGRSLLEGVAAFVHARTNWSMVTLPMWTFAAAPSYKAFDADGLIASVFSPELLERIRARNIPAVNVSAELLNIEMHSVYPDDDAVGRVGAKFFLERGFRSFLFLGWQHLEYARVRARGFAAELEAHGMSCVHGDDVSDWDRALMEAPKPVAVMSSNDTAAKDVLAACLRLGLAVPEVVSVLGVDDDDLICAICKPRLASISLPAKQIGYEAAKLLEQLMDGQNPPVAPRVLQPGQVVVRASADIFAIDDADVAEALRFIREQAEAQQPIHVDDVFTHVAIGRRTLERKFRQALGRTPLDEIQRVRLERAKRLLSDTDLRIPDVAKSAGYGDDTRFNLLFRRLVGTTPTEYRRRTRFH